MKGLQSGPIVMTAPLGGWLVVASLLAACGDPASSGAGGDAGSDPIATSTEGTACGHLYDAQYTRCGGPTLPAPVLSRDRIRYEHVCAAEMGLPGSGVTVAGVEACVTAIEASPCQFPAGPPTACVFRGSLPRGAPCTDGAQCVSGQCDGTVVLGPDGPTMPYMCGACEPLATVGNVCSFDNYSAGCDRGTACITMQTMSPDPEYVCVAATDGDVGAACDDRSTLCKPGLYCSAQTAKCAELAGASAPCGEGAQGLPGGCRAPLGCGDAPSTCRSGSAGATCVTDEECAPGFGCVPVGPCATPDNPARIGCSASGQCVAITWASPGQPCSDSVRCLVGSCNYGTRVTLTTQDPDGGLLAGTCPPVVADGEPCTVTSTCDSFAQCFQGTCKLIDDVTCN
jgi:hypothetical protein